MTVRGEKLVEYLSGSSGEPGECPYELLEEMWRGHPVDSVRTIALSNDAIGRPQVAWMLSELRERARPLVDLLPQLLRDSDSYTRYYAVESVRYVAGSDDGQLLAQALRALTDADPHVQSKALWLLANMDDEQLDAATGHASGDLASELSLLRSGEASARWRDRCERGGRLDCQIAVAAVARDHKIVDSRLPAIAASEWPEVREFAAEELRWRETRARQGLRREGTR